jgi:hypothetical protein
VAKLVEFATEARTAISCWCIQNLGYLHHDRQTINVRLGTGYRIRSEFIFCRHLTRFYGVFLQSNADTAYYASMANFASFQGFRSMVAINGMPHTLFIQTKKLLSNCD